jgi:hypothetical protein
LALCILVAAVAVLGSRPAVAACHHFMVAAAPNPVTEGDTVTLTVSRDAALAPSNVDVSTIDETAKGGQDYTPLRETVRFTNETSRTFTIKTLDDNLVEPAQTFRLHLSNPGGCAINPNYVVDPDARVTIQEDNDTSVATTATPAVSATAGATPPASRTSGTTAGRTSSTAAGTASTGLTAAPSTETAAASTSLAPPQQAAGKHKGGGGGSGSAVAAIAVVLVAAAGGGGYVLYRLRRRTA